MCYSILQVAANTLKQELILAAVVEYTIHRVYIGMLEIDELTYCKTPLGKIDENFSITKINTNSVTLNKKDIQQFSKNESQFLISSCLCPVKDLN